MNKYNPMVLAARFNDGWFSNLPILTKLVIAITLALIAAVTIQGIIISDNLSSLLEDQTDSFGESLTRQVANQLKEPILSRDELTAEHIVNTLLNDDNIVGITVFSENNFLELSRGINPASIDIEDELLQPGVPLVWQGDDSVRYITFYSPSTSNKTEVGKVYITFSTELLAFAESAKRVITLMSTLLVIVVGLILAYYLSKIITRPIYKLIDASRAIASGDYQTQFDKKRGDELGVLSDSLNSMTEALIHKGFVEQTLSRYLSEKVAKQVLSDGVAQGLGGKDVEASVLFADIVDFTSLSEKMDAEAVNRMLNDYLGYVDIAAQIAHGYVDKYIGDCAMLLFGVPDEDVDHRFHAIYSALLIRNLVDKVNRVRLMENKPIALFSIGINSGHMLAGNVGSASRMEYTVIGDAVNLASRLCGVARENEILVASSIMEKGNLEERVRFEKYGMINVKGKEHPVSACLITGVSDALYHRLTADTAYILSKAGQ